MRVELVKEFYIQAAHRNRRSGGIGARLHGHSFRIEVMVAGEIDPRLGWLIDYGDIKQAFRPLHDQLDHRYLNEIDGLENGSLSDIAAWIERRLTPVLPCLQTVRVSIVGDNAFNLVELSADAERDLPRRLRFTFEAAQSLPHLLPDHPCRRLHGHTYRIEVGAGRLEPLQEPLRAIYDALDHYCLNDIPDLNEATSERLCAWIWDRVSRSVPDLEVVIVQETATARCIYHGT
jgi:6-pyruvoyltetrahydropterin/6-carboxytetrahydropterin synthase